MFQRDFVALGENQTRNFVARYKLCFPHDFIALLGIELVVSARARVTIPRQIHLTFTLDPPQIHLRSTLDPPQIHLKSTLDPPQIHLRSTSDPPQIHLRSGTTLDPPLDPPPSPARSGTTCKK